ncbi:MAG TPA: class I SAM-dependent methyltransferase [Sphingomicrobium sp.]|nr:class I SAM-dependent methyltransferase [Sphingomicrobium sp.]
MSSILEPLDFFADSPPLADGVYVAGLSVNSDYDEHTVDVFSEKWSGLDQGKEDEDDGWKQAQYDWYLKCYGYRSEGELRADLAGKRLVLDAGCGPGYKAAWLAKLSPDTTVVAMDLSESIHLAARRYGHIRNLVFVRGDIARTPFRDGAFDLISCDQVLHHTISPPDTLREFARILVPKGLLNTYVYARKALPRELLDEHMRDCAKTLSRDQLWDLSDQLTRLGKLLSELNIEIDVPDMPVLGIKGGKQDLQRFIYWNFLKCFWNAEYGFDVSRLTNFDWYAPSVAYRYSRDEFAAMLSEAGFEPEFLHSEEACHTGRFRK